MKNEFNFYIKIQYKNMDYKKNKLSQKSQVFFLDNSIFR